VGCCISTPSYTGEEKNVVVIGGGFAGVHLCAHMGKSMHNLRITVLAPSSYMDIAWASPRAIADPASANRNVVPLANVFANGRVTHKRGAAASVSKTAVTTTAGEVRCYARLPVSSSPYTHSFLLAWGGSGDLITLLIVFNCSS
jgi:NADH dehydrogenase FAD-containing subunit